MAIYTRTGDKGETALLDGKRVKKYDFKVETYGTVDELNSLIGASISFIKVNLIKKELEIIQNDLLLIGSSLAVSKTHPANSLKSRPEEFEQLIDKLTLKMPPLNKFILPGGGKGASMLHIARTVSRRAERRVVELADKEYIDSNIVIYLNRLSDLLFTMARYVNFKEHKKEIIWKK